MYKLTDQEIAEDIIEQLNFEDIEKYDGEKNKLIRKLNETYQYCPECFVKTNKGDYTRLQELIYSHLNKLKYFN